MNKKGLTLVELMITIAVSAIVLAGIVTFWGMASKNWTAEQLKSLMQQQIEVGIERMKRELRISTSNPNEMVFYDAPGTANPPYEAISFPLPAYSDVDNRIIDRTTGGSINWGTTVLYHVYIDPETNITELRRTIFNNRADLTKEEREAQLATVVADGDGNNTCGSGETTNTETVFTNLVSLEIEGSAKFDGYNSSIEGIRSNNVGFGSALVTPGPHNVKFQIIGNNDASSGYGLGVDYVSLTQSVALKEGEDYYDTAVPHNGTKETPEDMFNNTNGVWSGNYHLEFSSSAVDSYIVMSIYYDEWRETNFDNGNISWDHTQRDMTAVHDYMIRLEGNDTTWRASDQLGVDKTDDSEPHEGKNIKVVILKDCLSCSGSAAKIKFSSSSAGPLKITSASFGVRNRETPNFSGTEKPLSFSGASDILILAGATVQSDPFELTTGSTIDKDADTDYLVSFDIDSIPANANCAIWDSSETGTNSYIDSIPSEDIFAVEDIFVSYVAQGTCTSQVYDTKINNSEYPNYKTLSSDSGGGTVTLEARGGDKSDLSDATDWLTSPVGMNGRQYAQFRVTLANTTFPYESTPEVKSVYLNWDPTAANDKKLVDVSGYFTMRPDYGIFKILIDDKELIRGISVTMKIEESVLSSSYKSQHSVEIYPRNTEKQK